MVRWLILFALSISLVHQAVADDALVWRKRPLRSVPERGYLVVVRLSRSGDAPARASLVCEQESVEFRVVGSRWTLLQGGRAEKSGTIDGDAAVSFFVKRTPKSLLLGVNGRWVYSGAAKPLKGKPLVRVGVGPGLAIESFRLVAREPVHFSDDFPNPEPQPGRWAPVRGRWALSSLASPEHSANPAELAALFDSLEDAASRGRTRHRQVGVGLVLGGGGSVFVARVAADSPAERAGIGYGDHIPKIAGAEVHSPSEATALLAGDEGTTVKVTVERKGGKTETIELRREMVVWGRSRRQVLINPYRPGNEALMTAGDDFWTDYRFTCAVRTQQVGAFGLVFAYLGPNDYHVFRWLGAQKAGGGSGRWQLERIRNGRRTVLARREGGYGPRDFYAMSVAITGSQLGRIKAVCSVDGVSVLEAADDAIVPGKIGFWAEAPGAVCFDDVLVAGEGLDAARSNTGTRSQTQRFDQHMKAWGNPAYAWQYDAMTSQWWHKSNFPGDVTLSSPVGVSGLFRLVICATRGAAASGYAFEIDAARKHTTLKRAGKVLSSKALGGARPKRVTLSRTGARVSVRLDDDDRPWLAAEDPEPLGGSAVLVAGVLLTGFRPSTEVAIESPNVLEYYFNSAPTDWHVMHGYWEVMNRWICDPRWSFFGGRAEGALAIWNKRRLEGDCFAEFYVGPMMLDRSASYENLRDIGITLCGDGRNLASGYTLILGANSNQVTALFRNGRIVASRRDSAALIPRYRASGANSTVFPSRHRGWVPVALAKQGGSVQAYLFGRLILTYHDPDPLPGGYTAFWSVDNGVLLAKARLAASRVSQPHLEPFLRMHPRFSDGVLTNDCADGEARIVLTGDEYEIINTAGGGPFAVALRPRVYSAFDRPTISFDVKLTPEAKVDLYVRCGGQLYRIIVAGPAGEDGGAKTLGAGDGVKADGQWHTVRFDLLAALRKERPDDPLLMVWQPMLANFATHGYLVAGFGGNGAGARYWLRNVSLPPAEEPPRLSHKSPTQ